MIGTPRVLIRFGLNGKEAYPPEIIILNGKRPSEIGRARQIGMPALSKSVVRKDIGVRFLVLPYKVIV